MQANSNKTFADIVHEYIREKRATGVDFTKDTQMLRRIVELQQETDRARPRLSRELLTRWSEKTAWESETNRSHRISTLRGLGGFMRRMGYESVVVPTRMAPIRDYAYTPYIFSERELRLVLAGVDRLCAGSSSSHAKLLFPVVFRILIGCGTRIGETLRIEKKDLNLETGSLALRNTKNHKERLIPMADSLTNRCRAYAVSTQSIPRFTDSPWLFPKHDGTPYNRDTAYTMFRNALHEAGVSHGGRGKGPRLHDLRHTFAVRVLNKWVADGKNLTTALPYLAIYMGHEGLKASQHYLRLTASMFPQLVKTVEQEYGWVIPEPYHE